MPSRADRALRAALSRRRLAAALLVGLAVVTVWILWPQFVPDESLRRVQEAGVLRVGMEATFPPFETTDGAGNFGGFDVDLAQALAASLGVQAEFANLSYDTLYDALAARRVDVLISMMVVEPERTADVSYSPPYYDAGLLLVVGQGTTEITGTVGLVGRRVAVEAGSVAEEEVRRLSGVLKDLTILTFSEPEPALLAVAQGEADAAVSDPVSLAAFRKSGGKVMAVGPRLTSETYSVVTLRGDRALSQEVGRIVEGLRASGELDRLAAKWF
ncbi:MAG: ABC transporter substrate-binding protein [Chloroflexota bacterium]|nr:ABC transporter substrate-binding protein [Chloroflexota bacterium]